MKYIITIALILFVILPWFFKMMMGYFARNFFNVNGQVDKQKTTQHKTRKQGDIHIDKQPERDKKIKDDVGEYVDYEEIK
jgi:hypothetical protein